MVKEESRLHSWCLGRYLPPESRQVLPLFARISAGFPSPADDFAEASLDLNELCISHPAATFFVRVVGESMILAGIFPGDILIVDRSLTAKNDNIVVAAVEGDFTVKRFRRTGESVELIPENESMVPVSFTARDDVLIWGVVTFVIHQV
jgi:DNA polymerase V